MYEFGLDAFGGFWNNMSKRLHCLQSCEIDRQAQLLRLSSDPAIRVWIDSDENGQKTFADEPKPPPPDRQHALDDIPEETTGQDDTARLLPRV